PDPRRVPVRRRGRAELAASGGLAAGVGVQRQLPRRRPGGGVSGALSSAVPVVFPAVRGRCGGRPERLALRLAGRGLGATARAAAAGVDLRGVGAVGGSVGRPGWVHGRAADHLRAKPPYKALQQTRPPLLAPRGITSCEGSPAVSWVVWPHSGRRAALP